MMAQDHTQLLTYVERREVLPLDIETIVIEDDQLDKEAPPLLVQDGEEGHLTQLYEDKVLDGQVLSSRLIRVLEIVAPTPKVVRVGTRENRLRRVDTVCQLDPLIVSDSNRELGTRTVLQEGRPGTLVRTYRDSFVRGEQVGEELVEEELIEPAIREVVVLGGREEPATSVTSYQKTTSLAFEREMILDPLLPEGEEVLVRPGQEGLATAFYEEVLRDGQRQQQFLFSEETLPPVNELVRVGTGKGLVQEPLSEGAEETVEVFVNPSQNPVQEEQTTQLRIPPDLLSHFQAQVPLEEQAETVQPRADEPEESHFFADGALTLMSALGLANLSAKP